MNLLICEDEDIIRKGFILTIQKINLAFDHIYEARDGLQGLQLCQNHKPDIIITDIRMPLMDGLSFIAEAQKISPYSQFIILSGYNNFEYARTAIKYGVKDYLLKPCSKKEIADTLTRVIETVEQQHLQDRELQRKHNTYEKTLSQLQKIFLGDVLMGKYPKAEIKEHLSSYGIELNITWFLVLCLHISSEDLTMIHKTNYKLHMEWFSSVISEYFSLFPTEQLTNDFTLILGIQKPTSRLRSVWLNLEEQMKDYEKRHGIRFYFSVSRIESNICELPCLYQEAEDLLHYRFFHPDSTFFSTDICMPEAAPSVSVPSAMLESLYHSFVGKSRFDFRQDLYKILQYVSVAPDISPLTFSDCIEKAGTYLTVTAIQNKHITNILEPLELDISESFRHCGNMEQVCKTIYTKLSDYRNAILRDNSDFVSSPLSPVEQAISYIDQNYYKDLDLTSISKLVSMNSSYFSSQFKKRTGLSFSNYIQKVRLEKAKNFLLYSKQKLHEISESVGIGNEKYFCKLFKEYTGMTPTEFKNQNHERKER